METPRIKPGVRSKNAPSATVSLETLNELALVFASGAWILMTGLRVQLTNTSQITDKRDPTAAASAGIEIHLESALLEIL